MEFTQTSVKEPLVGIFYKYADVSQTERKLSNFLRSELSRFSSLEEIQTAIQKELSAYKKTGKRVSDVTTHTWIYSRMYGKRYRALSLNCPRHKGFIIIKENWRKLPAN